MQQGHQETSQGSAIVQGPRTVHELATETFGWSRRARIWSPVSGQGGSITYSFDSRSDDVYLCSSWAAEVFVCRGLPLGYLVAERLPEAEGAGSFPEPGRVSREATGLQ